jgi:5-methylcytosine-specific restriction protein A
MPRSAPTPCRYPGCMAVLSNPGYCDSHRALVHRDYGRMRRSFDKEVGFYQSSNWRRLRANFLRLHPLCRSCANQGRTVAAVVVDHVLPIKDGGTRLDTANLQALCVSCHNRKTAAESWRRTAGG